MSEESRKQQSVFGSVGVGAEDAFRKRGSETSLRTGLVIAKSFISTALAAFSLWVILSAESLLGNPGCLADDPNLCAFKIASFTFSIILNLPLLAESLNMNKVFFVWILQGSFLTEKSRRAAAYYIRCAGELGIMNYDEEAFHVEGVDIVRRVAENISRPKSICEKLLSFVRSMFSAFIILPLFWIYRFLFRLIQSVFTLPYIMVNREYRQEMRTAWRNLLLLPPLMIADPLCVLLLFPLSYVVIFSSDSVQEGFLNLVAGRSDKYGTVQVFAQLDDEFVNNAFHPQHQLIDRANIYYNKLDSSNDSFVTLRQRSLHEEIQEQKEDDTFAEGAP